MGIFRADRYIHSVDRISLDELAEQGIRAILFDRDNTVVPRDARVAPPEIQAWLDEAVERGFKVYMVSNNWHTSEVQRTARELGVEGIDHALKPFPFGIRRAIRTCGVKPEEAVMIGDQVFTDIMGGNLAGCPTIMVRQQSKVDIFPPIMAIVRAFERMASKGAVWEGE